MGSLFLNLQTIIKAQMLPVGGERGDGYGSDWWLYVSRTSCRCESQINDPHTTAQSNVASESWVEGSAVD